MQVKYDRVYGPYRKSGTWEVRLHMGQTRVESLYRHTEAEANQLKESLQSQMEDGVGVWDIASKSTKKLDESVTFDEDPVAVVSQMTADLLRASQKVRTKEQVDALKAQSAALKVAKEVLAQLPKPPDPDAEAKTLPHDELVSRMADALEIEGYTVLRGDSEERPWLGG